MSRISAKFKALRAARRIGLVAYLTVGFPDIASTVSLVTGLVDGGADFIELGVPFSDPLADGMTIQRASHEALLNGVTVKTCFEAADRVRKSGVMVPILFMGYYNPVFSYGLDRFCAACQEVGVDGLIIPDLPPEEATELRRCCQDRGMDLVFFLAPTSTEERIDKVAELGSGFIYCVSLMGVTGVRRDLSAALPEFLQRVRAKTDLPLAVGFGIATREHVRELSSMADAAVVGSAIIDLVEKTAPEERQAAVSQFIKQIKS
ncbi:MAG: tryptophan synthase subunit alpha [Dehalococcoidia bacterium]|nr:tryptophan synthase subunit alpha [Dehalococcoidia bacterium]